MSQQTPACSPNLTRPWKNWIDWAKTIGMLCIVWGHTFPVYLSPFIYAFNVPLFFFLSGYLTKEEFDTTIFYKKLWHNLIVPYLILGLSLNAIFIVSHKISLISLYSVLLMLVGVHSMGEIIGCSSLWFVYTLILIKVAFFYASRLKYGIPCIGIIAIVCMFAYNLSGNNNMAWAFTNTFIALPYFIAGFYTSKPAFHKVASAWILRYQKTPLIVKSCIILLLIGCTFIVSSNNDNAFLFKGQYGHCYPLFLMGSITGIGTILMISHLLDGFCNRNCHLISIGSIIILAYHLYVLVPALKVLNYYIDKPLIDNVVKFGLSITILILFIPIIMLTKRFFPILLGSRAKK
ncbi:MAG: acyltransferase family protein [Alloprevotella sp.]|nr:acyltransferase family protein [Alloprevotella sp.]